MRSRWFKDIPDEALHAMMDRIESKRTFDDPDLPDVLLNRIMDDIELPKTLWHPRDPGVDRYFGMVFYWFDRADFNIRIPLSVVNTRFDPERPELSRKFYIRWGNWGWNGAFCIVVQEPNSIAKQMPKARHAATWRFLTPAWPKGLAWARFPNYSRMRWGYVNIAPQQIFLHWWHTGYGEEAYEEFSMGFGYYGTYYLKEWPKKDPIYPLYQRVIAQLVKKEWTPVGSYFDLRKM